MKYRFKYTLVAIESNCISDFSRPGSFGDEVSLSSFVIKDVPHMIKELTGVEINYPQIFEQEIGQYKNLKMVRVLALSNYREL